MSNLKEALDFSRTYCDDLLCLSNSHFNEQLEGVEKVLVRLHEANIKVIK